MRGLTVVEAGERVVVCCHGGAFGWMGRGPGHLLSMATLSVFEHSKIDDQWGGYVRMYVISEPSNPTLTCTFRWK